MVGVLRAMGIITVSANNYFSAEDHLVSANVGWTGNNFVRIFLEKVERSIPSKRLAVYRLNRASQDPPILTELGRLADVSLAHFFELLKEQSNGQEGALLTNGSANIFYVRDSEGKLWAMTAYWYDSSSFWHVEAYSLSYPILWSEGNRVFSRIN